MRLLRRLRYLLQRNRHERELDDELQFHLQMKRRELESQGLDRAAAAAVARRALGNLPHLPRLILERRDGPGAGRTPCRGRSSRVRGPCWTACITPGGCSAPERVAPQKRYFIPSVSAQ